MIFIVNSKFLSIFIVPINIHSSSGACRFACWMLFCLGAHAARLGMDNTLVHGLGACCSVWGSRCFISLTGHGQYTTVSSMVWGHVAPSGHEQYTTVSSMVWGHVAPSGHGQYTTVLQRGAIAPPIFLEKNDLFTGI